MLEPKQTERQVKEFFSRSPIDDPLYLKKFIREHPDQKMAWYLLGREYTAQGKHGKAAYCFAQAGEVYEAFEKQKLNVDLEQLKREAEASAASAAKPERKLRRRLALLGAGLAALLLLSALASDAEHGAGARATGGDLAATTAPRGAETPTQPAGGARGAAGGAGQPDGPAPGAAGAAQQPAVLYAAPGEVGAGAGAAAQAVLALLASGGGGAAIAAEGAVSEGGRWVYWQAPAKLLFQLGSSGEGANRSVRPLDPQACTCQPEGADEAHAVVTGWAAQQEEQAVLRSAVAAYKQLYGAVPQQPEQLARPYPDNLLPGLTSSMREQFPNIVQALQNGAGGQASGERQSGDAAKPVGTPANPAAAPSSAAIPTALTQPLAEPLRIVVDKDQHRLGLLSGNRIVRLYTVGLGGDRTPEGEFAITEKVRNPNNKSNGDFGSRGMTLSDSLYAIHGTNKPDSIGKDDSLGCVRMRQADIEELYDMVPHGTKVTIGRGLLPPDAPLSAPGEGDGAGGPGKGKGKPAFRLPLQTDDSNPKKTYHWLD